MISIVVVIHRYRRILRLVSDDWQRLMNVGIVGRKDHEVPSFRSELDIHIGDDQLAALVSIIEPSDSRGRGAIRESVIGV